MKAIRPKARTNLRPHAQAVREVEALLVASHGYRPSEAEALTKKWAAYVRARWSMRKAPCQIADHLAKFEEERLVSPRRR